MLTSKNAPRKVNATVKEKKITSKRVNPVFFKLRKYSRDRVNKRKFFVAIKTK
jgi:hypothetical protein